MVVEIEAVDLPLLFYISRQFTLCSKKMVKPISEIDVGSNRMEIKQTSEGKFITLQPSGELDANSSVHLDEVIQDLVTRDMVNIHVDFSDVSYISSAGMGVFISYIDEVKNKGGKLVLSQLSDNVREVFDLLGLSQLITIVQKDAEVEKLFNHEV